MSKVLELIAFMQEVDAAIDTHYKYLPFRFDYTIAGGALRDTLLGMPVKDIDIVVASRTDWDVDWDVDWPAERYGPTGGFSAATHQSLAVRGLPVQLIFRDGDTSTDSMMAYHSMAISNVFWCDGALTIDQQFFKDVADKQHTVNRKRWGGMGELCETRLETYINKITAKYPWPIRGEQT